MPRNRCSSTSPATTRSTRSAAAQPADRQSDQPVLRQSYLDGFDHFVTEVLHAPFLRYVDDFALFYDDPAVQAQWRRRITLSGGAPSLRLHPRETVILATAEPSAFLGFVPIPAAGAVCWKTMSSDSATACAPVPRRPRK